MKRAITKSELNKRAGYFLIGFFTFYLVTPLRDFITNTLKLNPVVIGVGGIILTLYFFDFG